MAFKHCCRCGWGFTHDEWVHAAFCSNCGLPLGNKPREPKYKERQPRPEPRPPPAYDKPRIDYYATLRKLAKEHPWLFSAGAIGTGIGAVMLAPQVLLVGQAAMAIGAILMGCGMLGSVYADPDDGAELISAGWLLFLGGVAVALIAFMLATAGIVAVAGGSGVALKAGAEEALRWRLRKRMESKSFTELLQLAQRMNS